MTPAVSTFSTDRQTPIYQIPMEVFPGFWAYAYLVMVDDMQVLIDTGSGFGKSNEHLEAGLASVAQQIDQPVGLNTLTHIFISHGHIDHFGGLAYIQPRSRARIGVHELDRRILTNYEERTTIVTRRLGNYLVESGVPADLKRRLLELYSLNKNLFRSVPIHFSFEAVEMQVGPFEFLHLPGHCSGQVVIRLEDVLFAGDFVLSKTTPHMAPESLTLNTGLGHYLDSLRRIEAWLPAIRVTLAGHEDVITDLGGRLRDIRDHHQQRLETTLDLLERPKTIFQVSEGLFGLPDGYNALLAVEEAGAHVEYLYTRGQVGIANLAETESRDGPVALTYQRI